MSKSLCILVFTFLLTLFVLTACGNSSADEPAKVVEAYWHAMAAKDSAALSNLVCADYEVTALNNLDSFQSVDLSLKDLKCTVASSNEDSADVTCSGSLVTSYDDEDASIDLAIFTFAVNKEGGDWLVCGEH